MPGGEEAAAAGEHADPQPVLVVEPVEGGRDAAGHVAVDRVARLGTVDGDTGRRRAPRSGLPRRSCVSSRVRTCGSRRVPSPCCLRPPRLGRPPASPRCSPGPTRPAWRRPPPAARPASANSRASSRALSPLPPHRTSATGGEPQPRQPAGWHEQSGGAVARLAQRVAGESPAYDVGRPVPVPSWQSPNQDTVNQTASAKPATTGHERRDDVPAQRLVVLVAPVSTAARISGSASGSVSGTAREGSGARTSN